MICVCGDPKEKHLGDDGPCMHCRCNAFEVASDSGSVDDAQPEVSKSEVEQAKADLRDTLSEFSDS